MTTFLQARAEPITALLAAGVAATDTPGGMAAPYVLVTADGGNTNRLVAGLVQADFRFVLVAGVWDAGSSAEQLDTLKQVTLTTLRNLAGWQVRSLGRDGGRDWAGGTYLTCDVEASRLIDL